MVSWNDNKATNENKYNATRAQKWTQVTIYDTLSRGKGGHKQIYVN